MIKCVSIKNIKKTRFFSNNSCSSWCIIQKCQFTKWVTGFISFKESRFGMTFKNLGTFVFSRLNDVKTVSIFTFSNNIFSGLNFSLVHCINDYFKIRRRYGWKHKCLCKSLFNLVFNFLWFWNDCRFPSTFDIPSSKNFSRNTISHHLFRICGRSRQYINIIIIRIFTFNLWSITLSIFSNSELHL